MVITLIGYRATGKSSVAIPLAARLDWDWIDADVELERREGRTIRDIFAGENGERCFRQLERKLIAELLQRDRVVIAAGGGAILNEDTRAEMKSAGPVVWLQAPVDEIERRIRGDETTAARRPNLTATGGRSEIEHLLTAREPFYRECAALTIQTDDKSVAEIVECIIQFVAPLVSEETRS